jgi:hypothetical protein
MTMTREPGIHIATSVVGASEPPADPSTDAVKGRTITGPFDRIILSLDRSLLSDDILPPGTLLECASVDVLNCYINYVDLAAVITERDPEEDERYISISNQFYTHFHEFGTVIHVIGGSARHWWYFCYDIDANDCTLGRVGKERTTLAALRQWVESKRLSGRYPTLEIDATKLRGWRSFQ